MSEQPTSDLRDPTSALRPPTSDLRYSNPFATRYVRPGALPFLFAEGESVDSVVERLQECGWRGQIVGPHGSGKSTLIAALVPALVAAGKRVLVGRVQGSGFRVQEAEDRGQGTGDGGQRSEVGGRKSEVGDRRSEVGERRSEVGESDLRPSTFDFGPPNSALRAPRSALSPPTSVWIVDGYEQLWWWSRWRLRRRCARAGAGLLVTAHEDVGFPTLVRTTPTVELVERIVARLLPPDDVSFRHEEIVAAFHAAHGNVRETLFALYDQHAARQRVETSR